MHYYNIQPVIRRSAKLGVATYSSKLTLHAGSIVRIPYGSKTTSGIVLDEVVKPNFKTKPIDGLISEQPLPNDVLQLARSMLGYYPADNSMVYSLLVPNGAHKNRRGDSHSVSIGNAADDKPALSKQQQQALNNLGSKNGYHTWLLHGVTGSGKTRVYFEQAARTLKQGRSCIILVPEIALSSQLLKRAENYFDFPIYTLHSGMTESEAHKTWQSILEQKSPCIIVGPRSALYAPVNKLGLIVIDECHDQSYKQDQHPHYNALHVAAMRAKHAQAKLIMGSATPNITEFWFTQNKNISLLTLPNTVFKQTDHARHIVDTRKRRQFTRSKILSNDLLDAMHEAMSDNRQALLYVNRRGHSPVVACSECDWRAMCSNCELPLVYHSSTNTLRCHVCNTKQPVITKCPECKSIAIRYRGVGTQRLETEVRKLFPNAKVSRLDQDVANKNTTNDVIARMHSGELDVLVGTQMITKGFDFQQLSVVGIVNADSMLYLPDYRSSERAFQVIYQSVGRNDRLGEGGVTYIQTASPKHHAINLGVSHNYDAFYAQEIKDRKSAGFPPFSYILQITARRKTEAGAQKALNTIRNTVPDQFRILGPAPALHAKQGSNYVWHLVILSKKRSELLQYARSLAEKNVSLDLDPLDLL